MHRHSSMNRVYRLVWNETLRLWVAVAENAKGRGKSGTGRRLLSALLALNLGFLLGPPATAGPADGIVVDGRTQTSVTSAGNTVSVNTATVTGSNAFNSFSKFNVGSGVTANLYLPSGTSNLINLVRDARSDIYGMVNAVKDGQIGGNVWFANPYGMVVGAGGVVNVGALTMTTPTVGFIDGFFNSPNNPDATSVSQLLAGTAPRNAGGTISIQGRINAINGVSLSAGAVNVSGSIYSGAHFIGSAPDFSDVVNANGLATGSKVVVKGGSIVILADNDVTLTSAHTDGPAQIELDGVSITASNVTMAASSSLTDASLLVSNGINPAQALASVDIQSSQIHASGNLSVTATAQVTTSTNTLSPVPLSVQRVSSQASVTVGGSSALQVGGNASLAASSTVSTDARPSTALSNQVGDASVAVSDVNSSATVRITDTAAATVGGALGLQASNTVNSNSVADASAAGSSAGGASVAVSKLRTTTSAGIDGAAQIQAGALAIGAVSKNTVLATAKAAAQGAKEDSSGTSKSSQVLDAYKDNAKTADSDASGGVKVAGAVVVSDLQSTTTAFMASSTAAQVTGAVTLGSQSSNSATISADASAVGGATGVAVAVAINLAKTSNQALLNQVVTAGSLSATAGMAPGAATSTFSTAAVSGAGASNVGIAGALAVNALDSATTASLGANSLLTLASGTGTVSLAATNNTASSVSAKPGGPVTGDKLGIGASVAVNVVGTRTSAELADGAQVVNASDVTLDAQGSHSTQTEAEAGSEGGISVTPSVAIALINNRTSARLGSGATLTLAGDLLVRAQQSSVNTTSAKGSAVGGKAAIGAAVGVALVDDSVEATTARTIVANGLSGAGKGAVTFSAEAASASTVNAIASASGGHTDSEAGSTEDASVDDKVAKQLSFGKSAQTSNDVGDADQKDSTATAVDDQKNGKASASSSEGKLSVAAAVGVNIQNSSAKASVPASGSITAAGKLTLGASNNTDSAVTADGSALPKADADGSVAGSTTKVGIGAAVAVNLVKSVNEASIGQNASISSKGLALQASMTDVNGDGTDLVNTALAQASSGAGGSSVGLAGSLALNLVDNDSTAAIRSGAVVNANSADVSLAAANTSSTTAKALPSAGANTTGGKVGIGASVAVNIVGNRSTAQVEDTAQLNAPGNVALQADGTHSVATEAEAGSEGGVSITPAVALAIVNNSTIARLGTFTSGALSNAGSVSLAATQLTQTSTSAKGSAQGEKAAIGAAVAIALVNDTTTATTDRNIVSATGNVSFAAVSASANTTSASASSTGGKSDDQAGTNGADGKKQEDATVDDKVGNQVGFGQQQQTKNNVGDSNQQSATGSSANGKPSASSSEGKVSVAAAVAVNVVGVNASATIGAGRTVSTSGALALNASGNTDGTATSDATAVGNTAKVGIGAAVSVNKVDTHTLASIGQNASVSANGVTVQADMTDQAGDQTHTLDAQAQSGAGGSKVGIAASLALNLATTSSRAQIGSGASVNALGGDVVLSAEDRASHSAKATPTTTGGATGGKVGVGVSVALNLVNAESVANIGQNAAVAQARDIDLTATSEGDSHAEATAGASGGKLAFDAAVAVTTLNQATSAAIASGGAIHASGDVSLAATSNGTHTATAKGVAKSGSVAVGASVGTITSNSTTSATLDRNLAADGSLTIAAGASRAYTSDASASAGGSQSEDSYNQNKTQADSASSSKALKDNQNSESNQGSQGGGKVAVAAAVGVTVLADAVSASVTGGRSISSGTAMQVSASNTSNFSARGAGDAVDPETKVGVAVGVGIAISNNATTAALADGTQIATAGDITVQATSSQNRDAGFANKLAAEGIAGAGGNKVGVAGAFAVVVSNAQTLASLGANTRVTQAGNINVNAFNTSMLGAKAWAGAVGGKVGVGAAVATIVSNNQYKATVGSGSDITAASLNLDAENRKVSPGSFTLNIASVDDVQTIPDQLTHGALLGGANYYTEAVSGAAGDTAAVAGAFAVSVFKDQTETAIGSGSSISTSGALALTSNNDTTSTSLAAAASVGGKVGVGVSSAVVASTNDTSSHIDAGTSVSQAGSIGLSASSSQDVQLISFSGGVGGSVGVSGVANVLTMQNQARAYVADSTTTALNTSGNFSLAAANTLQALNIASGVAVGGSVGVGIAAAVNTIENQTQATLGNDVSVNAARDTRITATAAEDLTAFTIGAAAAGSVAVGGAALVNVLNTTTEAEIGLRAKLNKNQTLLNQSVAVAATDTTTLFDVAVGAGGGGSVGGGAAGDVGVIHKNTHASIGDVAWVDAAKDVAVQATSTEDFRVTGLGFGVGGSAGLAGSVGVYSLTTDTTALVGNDATLRTQGSALVAADGSTTVDFITGSAAAGGSAAIGAAAGVLLLDKTTYGAIGDRAAVTALGNGSGISAANGIYSVSYGSNITGDGRVTNTGFQPTDATGGSISGRTAFQALVKQRNAARQTSLVQGLAVTATNSDSVKSFAITGGVAGAASVMLGANVLTLTTDTQATIGSAAQINQGSAIGSANSAQSVRVAAGNEQFHLGLAGAAAGAGAFGAGAGADVFVANNNTLASVGLNTQMKAARDVEVLAHGHEQVLDMVVGMALAGTVAIAGSVSVVSITDTTQALVAGGTTRVDAGGNMLINASDDTSSDMVAGAAAAGLGAAGLGVAVGVTTITKDTQAGIGNGATVNALGASGAVSMAAYTGATEDATGTGKGLQVQATSSEDLFTIAASAAAGLYAGVSGAVSVEVVKSNTLASIGDNTRINTSNTGANAAQDVNVSARNVFTSQVIAGSLAAGAGALAGGVDVGIAKNNTAASIGSGAQVNAQRDVLVNALGKESLSTTVVSAAGGVVGVAGGISVYSVGDSLGNDSQSQLSTNKGTIGSQADSQASDGTVGNMLAGSDDARVRDVSAQAQAKRSAVTVSSSFTAAQSAGNAASIGNNAVIVAGRDLGVNARGKLDYDANAGAVAGGAVGLGVGVALADVKLNNQATIGNGVDITVANVTTTGDLHVNAAVVENASATGFAGAGGIVALNAAYASLADRSTTTASMGNNVRVRKADEVLVQAADQRTLQANTDGASVGAVAAGASVAQSQATGSTTASIGTGAAIGSGSGDSVRALSVLADSSVSASSDSKALSGGIGLAASGAVATAQATPTVSAFVSGGAIQLTQDATIRATGQTQAHAASLGVSLSLTASAGLSKAVAEGTSRVDAYLGASTALTGRNLSVQARQLLVGGSDISANATGASGALFAGINATDAEARHDARVNALVGDNSTLVLSGAALVDATNNTSQQADASGLAFGIVAAGFNKAVASSNSVTHAILGNNVSVNAPVTQPASMTASLGVTAIGTDTNIAVAKSGSGGIVSGAAASATTTSSSDTQASTGTGDASRSIAATTLNIQADHTTQFNASVDSVNASIVGASGASASNSVNSTVNAGIGADGYVRARFVDIDANNTSRKSWLGASNGDDADWNINSGSGGLVDLPAASSETHVSHNTTASVGSSADVHVLDGSSDGAFNMDALNTIVLQDKTKLDSGGLISVARSVSKLMVDQSNATVSFGSNANVVSDTGAINAGARSSVSMDARANANVYGLAGAPSGAAYAVYNGQNSALVGSNATIQASDGTVLLAAGQGTDGTVNAIDARATVNLWNKTAIPITITPDAQANVVNNATVDLATGSSVNAASDIALYAEKGTVSAYAKGIGKDLYREALAAAASGISHLFGGGDVSFDVTGGSTNVGGLARVNVDGTVLTGINRAASLTLGIQLVDANGNPSATPVTLTTYKTNSSGQYVDDDGLVVTEAHRVVANEKVLWRLAVDKTSNVNITVDLAQSVAAGIQDRISKLRSLMAEYAGDAVAVGAYQAEVNFLMFKLVELGLASGTFDANGAPVTFNPGQWSNPSPLQAAKQNILLYAAQASGATTTIASTVAAAVATTGTSASTLSSSATTLSGVDSSVKNQLLSLANKDAANAQYLSVYGSNGLLAQNATLQSNIASQQALNVTAQQSIATATTQVNTLLGEITSLTAQRQATTDAAQTAALQSQINSRQVTIETQSTQINSLVKAIADRNADISTSAATLKANTTTIQSTQASLATAFSDGSNGNQTIVSTITSSLANGNAARADISTSATTIATQQGSFTGTTTGYVPPSGAANTPLQQALADKASALTQVDTLAIQLPTLSSVAANGPIADFVHVDDITVKLGNIRTKGDVLTGGGALKAPGNASIAITNNTPDFLVLNKLTVANDDGGTVRFNGAMVNSAADINSLNKAGAGTNNLSVLTRDTQGAAVPSITVTSNYNPNAAGVQVLAPSPDIQLQGDITNLRGSVAVHSKAGSIYSSGNVNAGTVDVKADNGDFVQSYVDGFYNVGGDPGSIKDGLTTLGGGIIANGSVFLSARYLNINSLVQSGIANWNITLPTAPILTGPAAFFGVADSAIQIAQTAYDNALPAAQANWVNPTLSTSSGRTVTYNVHSKRIEVDMSWAQGDMATSDWSTRTGANSGLYQLVADYGNIGASYDPANNRFVLDGTQVRGGSIQVYGQILNTSSTGTGTLRALDGYGQITVNNPTGLAVVINNLDAGADPTGTGRGIAGVIDITDIQGINGTNVASTHTVYKRLNGVVTKNDVAIVGTDRSTTYAPQTGLRYNWTTGTDNSQIKYWEFTNTQWFGSSDLSTKPSGNVVSESQLITLNAYRISDGTYLTKATAPTADYTNSGPVTTQVGTSIWTKTDEWSNCNWWTLCIASKHHTTFDESIASKSITTKSLKADNAINIEFSGYDTGTVNVTSNASVLLNGNIRNSSGTTTIKAGVNAAGTTTLANQSIVQLNDTALTSGANVNLTASGSVGAAVGSNPAKAIALNVKGGALNADARNGNVLVEQTIGNLNIGSVKAAGDALAQRGRVTLVSDGTMAGVNAASRIQGNLIDLTSHNGGIGSMASPLMLNVGYTDNIAQRGYYGLKAAAAGNIAVQATNEWSGNSAGNLLLNTVVSTGGDVWVKAAGSVIDNNATEQVDTRTWTELLNYWDSMGLRAGTAENLQNQANTVRAFEQGKTQDYRSYWDARNRQPDGGAAYNAAYQYRVTASERTALVDGGWNDARIATYEADRTAQYHQLNASVGGLTASYSSTYAYVATDIDKHGVDGNSGLLAKSSWTERELGISVSAGLLKEVTNTNPVIKSANVQGRNVTIVAGTAIGETQAGLVIPTNADPGCAPGNACLTDAMKVALAAAERSDLVITDTSITVLPRKPLNFAASESLNASVTATPVAGTDKGNMFLASLGDALLGSIDAAGETRIKVRGSIVNYATNSPAVNTGSLILEAANGGIGYLPSGTAGVAGVSSPLRLNLRPGATLTARAAENVELSASSDMAVDSVYSRGDIKLAATGAISNANNDTQINVLGDNVSLDAGNSIGSFGNMLNVGVGLGGTITANAGLGIYLHGPLGHSFNVGAITAGGDVQLSSVVDMLLNGVVGASGSIALSAGNQLSFASTGAVLAGAAQGVSIDAYTLSMADGARLQANTGTVLINTVGDATITGISSGSGSANAVAITSGGNVIDGGDTRLDVRADSGPASKVSITAAGSIGKGNPLEMQLSNLKATAGQDVGLAVTGSVAIDAVQAGGQVGITASGAISGNSVIGQGDVALDAGTSLSATSLQSVAGSVNATARNGDLTVGTVQAAVNGLLSAPLGKVQVGVITVGADFGLVGQNDVSLANATVHGRLTLGSTGGNASVGTVKATSADISALQDVTVDALTVDTSFQLAGNQVTAKVIGTGAPVTGAITGYNNGVASKVNLTLSNPGGFALDALKTRTGTLNVPVGALSIGSALVVDDAVILNPQSRVVVDQHDRSIHAGAAVQLYSAGAPFAFSLYDNHVFTDAYAPYRDAYHDALTSTGQNRSVVETSEMALSVGGTSKNTSQEYFKGPVSKGSGEDTEKPKLVKFSGFPVSLEEK
ncbi:leukotoxin LktA family filamentous adhesin [Rhodoferax sp.]|uniref:leukotoxin LktA family filamentous adhesin n=1 Tax=Rhodoferax sp. TaxID=50421 RepID=UPI00374DDE1F